MSRGNWSKDSWVNYSALQQVEWPDQQQYEKILQQITALPPLVFAGEIRHELRDETSQGLPFSIDNPPSAFNIRCFGNVCILSHSYSPSGGRNLLRLQPTKRFDLSAMNETLAILNSHELGELYGNYFAAKEKIILYKAEYLRQSKLKKSTKCTRAKTSMNP